MRGPQPQGELRGRVHRMVPTPTLPDLQARLEALIAKGLVERVAPAPGSRAMRYAQLLSPSLHATEPAPAAAPPEPRAVVATPAALSPRAASAPGGLESRMEAIEPELKDLREKVAELLSVLD